MVALVLEAHLKAAAVGRQAEIRPHVSSEYGYSANGLFVISSCPDDDHGEFQAELTESMTPAKTTSSHAGTHLSESSLSGGLPTGTVTPPIQIIQIWWSATVLPGSGVRSPA
ncbi:hypothetical protein MBM_07062 [Drepanopeziza brunnea f. sp. 'multigermtubi' MB_m1]|uniref:Uncharacterized protein n=1 Tax=Marssonina brunnea f. sp. multigermtubi (strain MB_m1) TaxID=1072389 RepID=K1WPF3_MARBU|nr:uncharacterized protein MBM_07062 [Drepanopeziza brunnea f. sp. 'multigermtubi' MB_m1]EKD14851.1 hypothetical protein MBM_07062 [Drepanopeziza brunnea f. sp. 'multigermtubi' MB_m1]